MPELGTPRAEQTTKRTPLELAGQVVNQIRDRLPSPRRLTFAAGVGLSLLAACVPAGPDSVPPIQPPIAGTRTPGGEESQSPKPSELAPAAEPISAIQARMEAYYREHPVFPERRADGSREFSIPLRPEERQAIEQDINVMTASVKDLIQDSFLKYNKIDLDKIAEDLKNSDDEAVLRWSGRSNRDRWDWYQEEAYMEVPGTSFYVSFVKDRETGEVVYQGISFLVDKDGNYIDSYEAKAEEQTLTDFLKLPSKLGNGIKPPLGHRPGFSFDKLNWKTQLVRAENPEEGLQVPMYMTTEGDFPFRTDDGKEFTMSLWGGTWGVNSVGVQLHEHGRGPGGRGKGPGQP